jgi:hypothetical protein
LISRPGIGENEITEIAAAAGDRDAAGHNRGVENTAGDFPPFGPKC